MNNECFIFDDAMYKNKHPHEPIHLFITRGANIGKTFTLMVLVQALTCFYNIDPFLNQILQKRKNY
jgi:hypothetical protein